MEGGRLIVNGTHTTGGTYYVRDGATLMGRGTIGSKVNVSNGGTILAGDTLVGTSYRLNLKGGATVSSGGIIAFPLYYDGTALRNNRMAVTGSFTVSNATLELNMDKVTAPLPDDAVFTLFSSLGTVSGTGIKTIIPERPSETQEWDISTLLTDGKLRVKSTVVKLKGDVNRDGNVDISDIVAIINQIAGTATYEDADVNEDDNVDISDIVAVINIIAAGE